MGTEYHWLSDYTFKYHDTLSERSSCSLAAGSAAAPFRGAAVAQPSA
jgi:hypothetical protein